MEIVGNLHKTTNSSQESGVFISIVVPVYNEEENASIFYFELKKVLDNIRESYEILFIDDGSVDKTEEKILEICEQDKNVKLIQFSRNFGKEMATTAGINMCSGRICVLVDVDLQHPVELLPEFINKWKNGAEVVIGIRKSNKNEGVIKKFGSILFYKILNQISDVEIISKATDFRLIDRMVIDEFNRFTETHRMTRALIDWLGFKRDFIYFDANERLNGKASYGFWKLFKLAMGSFVSLSLFPLKVSGYLGLVITFLSGFLGLYILLGKYFFHEPFASSFSGPAQLAILIVFLVGIILVSLGLIALYIANIHGEVINRPNYVIRKKVLVSN